METPKIFESEYRFCLIVWEQEPVNSTELVRLCRQRLGWSKATTYTVLRRLCERGVLQNVDATVTSLVGKEQAQAARLDEMMNDTFEGSVPAFFAAFTKRQRLSADDVNALRRLIDEWAEDDRS